MERREIKPYTPDLPREDVDHMTEKAFELWSNASVLTFTKVFKSEADTKLSFVWRDHGDNSPFNGTGGGFAHVFLPEGGIGGDVHFDEEETGTNNFRTHELGQSLGLPRIDDIGPLMYPRYVYCGDVLLSQKDINAIQAVHYKSFNLQKIHEYDENMQSMDAGYPKESQTTDLTKQFTAQADSGRPLLVLHEYDNH
ncbi:hypothetical protein HPG69_018499 [Diceros bicornis minor]|uniref:Peptidase metallopeptidase domain-containing protein n=1 Tax=Diceros bicornis minor TaxID=77932 RepID=A0A7J7EZ85_DICBM|nr:hypothetical protein HPG69_018499 [Diceros bicornis minor]